MCSKVSGKQIVLLFIISDQISSLLLGYNPPKWTRIVAERDPKWPPNTRRAKDRGPVFCYSTNMTTNWCWKGSKMTAEYKKSKRPRSGILIFHQDEHEFVLKGIQHDHRIQEKQKTQVRHKNEYELELKGIQDFLHPRKPIFWIPGNWFSVSQETDFLCPRELIFWVLGNWFSVS